MCKFKTYVKYIENYRKGVSLRVTYFSKPSFLDEFVNKQSGMLGDSFAVRQLTEKEGEAVDVDTISHLLNIPLDYILKEKNIYIFNDVDFGVPSRVFISQYFIFIQMKAIEGLKIDVSTKRLLDFLDIASYIGSLDLKDISMIDEYVLGCDSSDLWNVLDKSAFGDIDVQNFVQSRYADRHDRGDVESNLVRSIVKRVNSEEKEICQIFLKSLISQKALTVDVVKNLSDTLNKMKEHCEHEVTRCFSENYCA